MSTLFRATIASAEKENAVSIFLEATNNEDQILQTKPIFYFAMIASIYWEIHEDREGYSYFGLSVDKPYDLTFSKSIPVLDHYINWGRIQEGEDVDDEIFEECVGSPYPDNIELEKLINIQVDKSYREDDIACGNLTITSENQDLIDVLKIVEVVSIYFDEAYFE